MDETTTSGEADERPPSLSDLFVAMEGPLLAYANQLMNDRNEAQDVVQEAFLRLHHRFDTVKQPRAWLYRTVRNLSFSHKRKHGKVVPFDPSVTLPGHEPVDEQPFPDAQIERMEATGMAMLCLDRLAEDLRELIHLKFVEELSYKEMSARTGLSVGNVGYKLHHAIKFLAVEMEREGILG